MDIGRDPFAPYSEDLGNLRPEGTFLPFFFFLLTFFVYIYIYIYIYINSYISLVLQVLNDHL